MNFQTNVSLVVTSDNLEHKSSCMYFISFPCPFPPMSVNTRSGYLVVAHSSLSFLSLSFRSRYPTIKRPLCVRLSLDPTHSGDPREPDTFQCTARSPGPTAPSAMPEGAFCHQSLSLHLSMVGPLYLLCWDFFSKELAADLSSIWAPSS